MEIENHKMEIENHKMEIENHKMEIENHKMDIYIYITNYKQTIKQWEVCDRSRFWNAAAHPL